LFSTRIVLTSLFFTRKIILPVVASHRPPHKRGPGKKRSAPSGWERGGERRVPSSASTRSPMAIKISLIGLGNLLLGDEGVGVHAVEALKGKYDFPEEVRLLDGGTLGLDLLHLIEGMDRVLFVDAVDLKKKPGTIAVIEGEDLPSLLEPKLSLHHVGLSDLLFASGFLGTRPAEIVLIGIQPETMEIGLELSKTIKERFDKLLETVLGKLREWGLEIEEKAVRETGHVSGHSV
jgi:hydrogenase maturation protease